MLKNKKCRQVRRTLSTVWKDSIVFSEFVEKILNESVSKEKTIISLIENNKKYQVQKGFLGYEIKEVK